MSNKAKSTFICSNCSKTYKKWIGQCEDCNAWNTIEEIVSANYSDYKSSYLPQSNLTFVNLTDKLENTKRLKTNIKEFDRVCGGGLVEGSAILLGGDPGIGKSTILMQAIDKLAKNYSCVYISGEESVSQIQRRCLRLGTTNSNIKLASSTSLEEIISSISILKDTKVLIIDSIQTVHSANSNSSSGSISQLKHCSNELISFCKRNSIVLIMVGHVTREGQIAGPRLIEHMVDCVLYFEGERNNNFRLLRAIKNRFGATDEIGVFEMTEEGLLEVENPSALFLHDYLANIDGTSVFAGIEGLRPLLVEIQALLTPTIFPAPRRAANGIDINRINIITAVLENRLNLKGLSSKDIYVNIAGGLKIKEPALDLAIATSIISSYKKKPMPMGSCFFGEISLSGQIRSTSYIEKRILEAKRLGFRKIFCAKIPKKQFQLLKTSTLENIEIIQIAHIGDLLKIF